MTLEATDKPVQGIEPEDVPVEAAEGLLFYLVMKLKFQQLQNSSKRPDPEGSSPTGEPEPSGSVPTNTENQGLDTPDTNTAE